MKINKTTIFAVLGSLIAVFAFFAIVGVNDASACDSGCENPPLTAVCLVSISHGKVGDVVTWTTEGEGGNGYYSFHWTGTDNFVSNYQTASIRYNRPGVKTATVEITSDHQTISRTCSMVIEEEVKPNLEVACVANPSNVKIGETVQYTANATGGTGSFSYSWSGTDGLSSSNRTVSKSYSTVGSKSATVTVQSGDQTRSATCSSNVTKTYEPPQNNDLDGSCTGRPSRPEEDERVTWTANPEGGNGNYQYEWSGTDGLDGNGKTTSMRYDDEGTKTARVRITSDGQSVTKTCTVRVDEEEDDNDDLEAYCKASPDDGKIGDRIRWTVYPDGGDGDYEYDWSGDDNLNGDDKTISKTYSTGGQKDASVRVESDGDRVTVRCSVDIERENEVYLPPAPPADNGIYLSSIPATGISPGMKVGLFTAGITLWSAFLAYLYIARKNEKMKEQAVLESLGE